MIRSSGVIGLALCIIGLGIEAIMPYNWQSMLPIGPFNTSPCIARRRCAAMVCDSSEPKYLSAVLCLKGTVDGMPYSQMRAFPWLVGATAMIMPRYRQGRTSRKPAVFLAAFHRRAVEQKDVCMSASHFPHQADGDA